MTTKHSSFAAFEDCFAFETDDEIDPRELSDFEEAWREQAQTERSRTGQFEFYDYVELIGF